MIWEFIRYHLAHYIWNFSCVCSKILLYECMPFGLNSSPVFCQELLPHPGYYPRSSAWWHCWACPLYQSELCSHSYFSYFNGNHCNRSLELLRHLPTIPNGLWWFQGPREKPVLCNPNPWDIISYFYKGERIHPNSVLQHLHGS